MQVVDRRGLRDMSFTGYSFTWSSRREDDEHIEERLDMFLCIKRWDEMWPSCHIRHVIWEGSDHYPVLLDSEPRHVEHGEKIIV